MEKKVTKQSTKTPNEELVEEYLNWIPDIGFSRARDTKLFRMIKIYRTNKTLINLSDKEDKKGQHDGRRSSYT
jgi:hypothetical protein